jgi:hypothetical protein
MTGWMASRGRPFEPGNKFGQGRPRGSRNKTTLLAQEMLHSQAPTIVNKCLELALEGDAVALRLCLERVAPVRSIRPVNLGSLPTSTVAELSQASDLVLRKVLSGELTILEARGMAQLIADRRKVLLLEEEEKHAEAQFLRMRAQAEVRRRERSQEDLTPVA